MALPWYYPPVIFMGALLIILSFLVFLHWLAQFYLDNQEKDNYLDVLDSDDDDDYTSVYEQHVEIEKNKAKEKKFKQKRILQMQKGSGSSSKVPSETSSVSEKSVKIRSKKRLAVSLSVKYVDRNLLLSGLIKGVIGLQFPEHGGPEKIRFKINLRPFRKRRSFKTPHHIPLDASLRIPFQFKPISREELLKTRLHLKLYGKTEKFGLPFGPEYCYGESFIDLTDLAKSVDEINVVQELVPLGSKTFSRESIKIRVSTPVITTQEFEPQLPVSPNDVEVEVEDAKEAVEDRSKLYTLPDS